MALALFGSGEFTEAATPIDAYLIERYRPSSVAVLPTAAGREKSVLKWIAMAEQHYEPLGIEVIPVPILNRDDAHDASLIARLDGADWIFFSGGDPGYLLETLRNTPLWDKVLERFRAGALLAGSSAGAMAMSRYTLCKPAVALMRRSDTSWAPGLAMTEYSVIPHFDAFRQHPHFASRLMGNAPATVQEQWMGIDEDTAIVFDNNEPVVLGAGSVEIHTEGTISAISPQ